MNLYDLTQGLYGRVDLNLFVHYTITNKNTGATLDSKATAQDLFQELYSVHENFKISLPVTLSEVDKKQITEPMLHCATAIAFNLYKTEEFPATPAAIMDLWQNFYYPNFILDHGDFITPVWTLNEPVKLNSGKDRSKFRKIVSLVKFISCASSAFDREKSNYRGDAKLLEKFEIPIAEGDTINTCGLLLSQGYPYNFDDLKKLAIQVTSLNDENAGEEEDRNVRDHTVGKMFSDAPESIRDLKVPHDFGFATNGIWSMNSNKFAINSPVFVSRIVKDANEDETNEYEHGEIMFEIMYKKFNGWKKFLASPLELQDAATVAKTLISHGIYIDSTQGRMAAQYFNAFMQKNEPALKLLLKYQKTGWHGKRFIMPQLSDGSYIVQAGRSTQYYKSVGSREVLLDLMRRAWKHLSCKLMISANLGSPLLNIVGCRNFTVALLAATQTGKTAAMRIGSATGGSKESMFNFNSTDNALEYAALERNDITLNVNEWQLVPNQRKDTTANILVHRHEGGQCKLRLDKNSQMREVKFFRNIMTITAEEPIVSSSSLGGVHTRVLEIPVGTAIGHFDKLKKEHILDHKLIEDIYDLTESNYGMILPEFCNKLETANWDEVKNFYKEIHRAAIAFRSNKVQSSHAEFVATLATAAHYFQMWFLGMEELESRAEALKFAMELIQKVRDKFSISDTSRAANFLDSWVAVNQKFFINLDKNFDAESFIPNQVYGYFKDGELYMLPTALNNALTDGDFRPEKIIREWCQESRIPSNPDTGKYGSRIRDHLGTRRWTVRIPFIRNDDQDPVPPDLKKPPKNPETPTPTRNDLNDPYREDPFKDVNPFNDDSRAATVEDKPALETKTDQPAEIIPEQDDEEDPEPLPLSHDVPPEFKRPFKETLQLQLDGQLKRLEHLKKCLEQATEQKDKDRISRAIADHEQMIEFTLDAIDAQPKTSEDPSNHDSNQEEFLDDDDFRQ